MTILTEERLLTLCARQPHLSVAGICKTVISMTLASILTGCVNTTDKTEERMEERNGYFADREFTATGKNQRVRFLVMHYTVEDEANSLKTLTSGQVSAHYLLQQYPEKRGGKPVILQLVDDNERAWHAGVSSWNGRNNLNDTSIGIEIVNRGYIDDLTGNRTWSPYTEPQIEALVLLAKDIIERHEITPDNVLGHSDIAPLRKQDPGRVFPWEALAKMGVGAWPDNKLIIKHLAGRPLHEASNVQLVQLLLKKYGYDQIPTHGVLDSVTRTTISAFQMHFRPHDISGKPDAETEAIAKALIEMYRSS